MFIRLKDKPFYFITDRDTKYTYLVHNQPQQQRLLYYPQEFEKMTGGQIRARKWKLVGQLMRWSLFNGAKMTKTDQRICKSKLIDLGSTLLAGFLLASFLRRALFRIQLPFFQMAFEKSIFRPRWLKSMAAYSIAIFVTYRTLGGILKQEYLVDLALEYKYNFNKSLTCSSVDPILNRLCKERYGQATQQ